MLGCSDSKAETIPSSSPQATNPLLLAQQVEYTSPTGKTEQCVMLTKIPGGDYKKGDLEEEAEFCSVSMYQEGFAVCPKTWSTSPGTMIYQLTDSEFSKETYESSKHCGRKARPDGVKKFAKFKNSMNAHGTSGTFSQSSLLYYHFSRYFDTEVKVPVAVYREIDKDEHLERVANKGLENAKGAQNSAGWRHLVNAEHNPSSYNPWRDIFTDDQEKIYGVLLNGKGERYGSEFNGTRESGWGSGQNRDFQKTAAFRALRTEGDLLSAVESGLDKARKSSKMRKDLVDVSDQQMVLWMREVTEIILLDYIFNQQDRIGNIDYRWYWAYVDGTKTKFKREKRDEYEDLPRKKMGEIPVPENLVGFNPILVQRSRINDNDAGGRVEYVNFTKKTKMLDGLKHYSEKIYRKLMGLNQDLQSQGPIYQWLVNEIDLTEDRREEIVNNVKEAAAIIKSQCESMIFDLDDADEFLSDGPDITPNTEVCQ